MKTLFKDIRYDYRSLLKNPGFTVTAVLTIALGIGAATAIFSVVYATLFEPLPYPRSEQLMVIRSQVGGEGRNVVSPGDYLDCKRRSRSFQGMEAGDGAACYPLGERAESIRW